MKKSSNKKKLGILVLIVILLVVAVIVFCISLNKTGETQKVETKKPNSGVVDTIVEEDERKITTSKAEKMFKNLPKIYTEAMTPFTDEFMLDAVMNKIMKDSSEQEKEADYSTENVDNMVKEIFGKEAVINKSKVSTPNVESSLFYYSEEAKSYAVIPVGFEGIFKTQILKEVTETDKAYYVYTYCLIGGYEIQQTESTDDEFGSTDYENSKVQVIVGDKEGKDLVQSFESFSKIYNENIWIANHANEMPIFRYTFTKDENTYYLTEVEQINY